MTLKQTIEAELKNAMRAGDETRKTALRGLIASVKLAEVEKRGELTDAEVLTAIQKEVKSQREAIADAEKASRADLVAQANALIAALETFLPRQLSREEVLNRASAVISQVGAAGQADMGKVMKVLQTDLKGQADGKLISDVVRELLAKGR